MEDTSQDGVRPTLNFNTSPGNLEYGDVPQKKIRTPRDPMSHRIIEKRRRDRMNNCLADLSHLIPATYLKQQGQGRIEKTEIIEMAIKHIRNLQNQVKACQQGAAADPNSTQAPDLAPPPTPDTEASSLSGFELGFQECRDEVMKFLVERQGHNAADPLCVNLLHHLQEQLHKFKEAQCRATRQPSLTEKPPELAGVEGLREPSPTVNTEHLEPDRGSAGTEQREGDHEEGRGLTSLQRLSATAPSIRDLDDHLKCLLGAGGDKKRLWSEDGNSETQDSRSCLSLSTGMEAQREGLMSVDPSGNDTNSDDPKRRRDSESSRGVNYKFKNDIKLRFSADMLVGGKVHSASSMDNQSLLSREEDSGLPPSTKMKEGSATISSSDTTSYPGSDFSSNGNGNSSSGNGHSISSSASSVSDGNGNGNGNSMPSINLANSVPGFALHPAGTYYIPVITPASQLMPFLQNYGSSGICHPISIPVNFGGPFICMQNLQVAQNQPTNSRFKLKSEGYTQSGSGRRKQSHTH